MNNKSDPIDKDALLVEYQASQESAQHHDNLVWTITSIIWGASLILFGLVLGEIGNNDLKYILTLLIFLIIILIFFAWKFSFDMNNIKNQKYDRCKDIEKLLNMIQHINIKYSSGIQKFAYSIITVFYIFIWLVLLVSVWK